MARPAHSLSTLRSAGYPSTTQDSLPAAGQALPGGGWCPARSHRKVSAFHRFPLSQAFLAHPLLDSTAIWAVPYVLRQLAPEAGREQHAAVIASLALHHTNL